MIFRVSCLLFCFLSLLLRERKAENVAGRTSVCEVSVDTVPQSEAITTVKRFYELSLSEYFFDVDSVRHRYLTQSLIERTGRMSTSAGADAVIRAQDIPEAEDLKTLSVRHLEGNWYMASYIYGKGGAYEQKFNFPVRVTGKGGLCKIDFITPPWHGDAYGDSLICASHIQSAVSHSDAESFVDSFYRLYTMTYCSMPVGLSERLTALHQEFLTPRAQEQFKAKAEEYLYDGQRGYDPLIGDFDFDCVWRASLKIAPVAENKYQVSYVKWNEPYVITVDVVKKGERFYIDGIK